MSSKKRYSFTYQYFGRWILLASRIFYRRFTIMGLDNFPRNKATILVSNHQNGMMDPLMCCVSSPEQLSFLTRADVFKKPIANKLARGVNMLPVYRPIDRVKDLAEKNEVTFQECIRRLESGNAIAMFPEGNHGNKKFLRPFKKGLPRLLFAAEEANDFNLDIQLVPVGIEYSSYTDFRADILMTFGEPIDVKPFIEEYKIDPNRANVSMLKRVKEVLSELLVDVKETSLYDTFQTIRHVYEDKMLKNLKLEANHANELKAYQTLIKSVEEKAESHPKEIEELESESKRFNQHLSHLGLSEKYLGNKKSVVNTFISGLALIIFFPVFVLGLLLNFIPFIIISEFVKKNIKDPHFKSSIKLAFGLFLFPIFWLLNGIIFWIVMDGFLNGLALIIAGLIFGVLAVKYWELYSDIRQKIKVQSLTRKKDSQFSNLMKSRKRIIELLDLLTQ